MCVRVCLFGCSDLDCYCAWLYLFGVCLIRSVSIMCCLFAMLLNVFVYVALLCVCCLIVSFLLLRCLLGVAKCIVFIV